MPKLTDSNRNLVRLAATMEKGSEERRALLAGLKIALAGGPQKGSVIFTLRDPKGKLLGSARGYASEGEAIYEFLDKWEGMASHFDAYRNAIEEKQRAEEKMRTLAKKVRPIVDEAVGRLGIDDRTLMDNASDASARRLALTMKEVQTGQEWVLDFRRKKWNKA